MTASEAVRVLLVEDDPAARAAMRLGLAAAGFVVEEAADAGACRAALARASVDVVLLDLGLPDADGMAVARDLREESDIGLIVVTGRREAEARIEALDAGADDYVTKPVDAGELAARVRSVARRRGPARESRRLGRWRIDLKARSVTRGAVDARLTRGEFDLLAGLVLAGGAVVNREELLAILSRRPWDADPRSVDVLISRIRRKLGAEGGEELVVTVPRLGYRVQLAPP